MRACSFALKIFQYPQYGVRDIRLSHYLAILYQSIKHLISAILFAKSSHFYVLILPFGGA